MDLKLSPASNLKKIKGDVVEEMMFKPFFSVAFQRLIKGFPEKTQSLKTFETKMSAGISPEKTPRYYIEMFRASVQPHLNLLLDKDLKFFQKQDNKWARYMGVNAILNFITDKNEWLRMKENFFNYFHGGWLIIQVLDNVPKDLQSLIAQPHKLSEDPKQIQKVFKQIHNIVKNHENKTVDSTLLFKSLSEFLTHDASPIENIIQSQPEEIQGNITFGVKLMTDFFQLSESDMGSKMETILAENDLYNGEEDDFESVANKISDMFSSDVSIENLIGIEKS